MLIALYNRVYEKEDFHILEHTVALLQSHNVTLAVYEKLYEALLNDGVSFLNTPVIFHDYQKLPADTHCLISFGGDGTILDVVTFIGNKQIPVMGINLGRLGFLAAVGKDEIEQAIRQLMMGNYTIDERALMHLDSNLPVFEDAPFALNEFTIHRLQTSSMIKVHTYLNGEFLNTYWADGLVIATPTGSTGYSLSCNGPVVFPQASNFIITPVAPHNLNIRPIVVPDDTVISFEMEGRTDEFLCTLDARSATITKDYQLAIRKESFSFKLIRLDEHNFLKTIRQKLYWGVDSRN
ncbi:MAG: NAD kinase [Bacteroidetes bacterium 47-18]|nr:MAG: NAD kinase [Bacteroidetes bacterium 47-18]